MEKLIQDGVLGIVTGILTTVLLFLVKLLWDSKLRPFIEEVRYRGVKLDGKWSGTGHGPVEEGGEWSTEMTLLLTQSAMNLGGTFSLKHSSPNNSFELLFQVTGQIWEGYAILNLKPIDRRVTSYATCLLKIGAGGAALMGQIAYRNVNAEDVSSERVVLAR